MSNRDDWEDSDVWRRYVAARFPGDKPASAADIDAILRQSNPEGFADLDRMKRRNRIVWGLMIAALVGAVALAVAIPLTQWLAAR